MRAQPVVEVLGVAPARVARQVIAVLVHVERQRRVAGVVDGRRAPRAVDVGLQRRGRSGGAPATAPADGCAVGRRCTRTKQSVRPAARASRSISGSTESIDVASEVECRRRRRPGCRPPPSAAGGRGRAARSSAPELRPAGGATDRCTVAGHASRPARSSARACSAPTTRSTSRRTRCSGPRRRATTAFSSSSRSSAARSSAQRNCVVEPEQHVRQVGVAEEDEHHARPDAARRRPSS